MDRAGEEIEMSESQEYPYATFLNVLYPSLSLVDIPSLAAAISNLASRGCSGSRCISRPAGVSRPVLCCAQKGVPAVRPQARGSSWKALIGRCERDLRRE
jgi:hypothetical protein